MSVIPVLPVMTMGPVLSATSGQRLATPVPLISVGERAEVGRGERADILHADESSRAERKPAEQHLLGGLALHGDIADASTLGRLQTTKDLYFSSPSSAQHLPCRRREPTVPHQSRQGS